MAKPTDNWVFVSQPKLQSTQGMKSAKGMSWRDEFQVAQSAFVQEIISALARVVTQSGGTVHASRVRNGLNYHTASGKHLRFVVWFQKAGSHPFIEIAVDKNPKTIKSKVVTDMSAPEVATWLWKKFPQGMTA